MVRPWISAFFLVRASAHVSNDGSPSRRVPKLCPWVSGNSIPNRAECARRAPCCTGFRIPVRSNRRPAGSSTTPCRIPAPRVPVLVRRQSVSDRLRSVLVFGQHGRLSSKPVFHPFVSLGPIDSPTADVRQLVAPLRLHLFLGPVTSRLSSAAVLKRSTPVLLPLPFPCHFPSTNPP